MSNKLSGTLTLKLPSGDNRFKAFFNVGESGFATEEYVKQQIAESEKKEEGKYVEKTDIQDTLNSDNSNKPLSANQGKVLKGLLDAKVIEAGAVPMDAEPTEGNINNVVSSDGLAKEFNKFNTEIVLGGVYDVSAHNNGSVFESLQVLLSSSNLSTLIPTSVRHGGMSIRFIQSSNNKYVQYRLMSNTWSTSVADWQGVDDKPTVGSDNLVKSGGVIENLGEITHVLETYRGTEDERKPYIVLAGNTINYSIKNNSTEDGYVLLQFHNSEVAQKTISVLVKANTEVTGTYTAEVNTDSILFLNSNKKDINVILINENYTNSSLAEQQQITSAYINGFGVEEQILVAPASIKTNLLTQKNYIAHIKNDDNSDGYYQLSVLNSSGTNIFTSSTHLVNAGDTLNIPFILSEKGVSVTCNNVNNRKTKFSIEMQDVVSDVLLSENRPLTLDALTITANNCTYTKSGNTIQLSKTSGNAVEFTFTNDLSFEVGDFIFVKIKLKSTISEWVYLIAWTNAYEQLREYYYLEAGVEREICFRAEAFSTAGKTNFRIEQSTDFNLENSTIIISDVEIYKNGYSRTTINNLDYSDKNKLFIVDKNGGGHFYSVANAVDYVRRSFDVGNIPYTIFVKNGIYDKEANSIVQFGYPYAVINKGSNLISIMGESKENTIIRWTNTPDVEYKVLEVGSSACVIANIKIECLKGTGYNSQTSQGHNPYCLHIDLGGDIDKWGKYQTEVYNCHLYDECHSPIGAGLTKNQTINVHDCYLEADSKTGNVFNTLYIHAHADGQSTVDNTMAVDIENNVLINKSGGKALTLPDVGQSTFNSILCTIIGNLLYSSDASNIIDVDASTRYNKLSYCMGNNIPALNSFEYTE